MKSTPEPRRLAEAAAECRPGEGSEREHGRLPPTDLVTRNRRVAEAALRPWTPLFMHGDVQVAHVFLDGDMITGVIDWSEAGQGDGLY